jgi:quinoprotein glucose dehydrogenase
MKNATLKSMRRLGHVAGLNRLGTGQQLRPALLALGWLLAPAQAQPVPGTPAAPLEPGAHMAASAVPPGSVADPAGLAQWRAELAGLAATNSEASDRALSAWLDRLLAGTLPGEIQLEVLEAAGKHDSPVIQNQLAQYRAACLENGGMASLRDELRGGSAEQGRKIFFEKKEASCNKCHRVGSEGGVTGPPLDGVATNLTREGILQSILFPNAKTTPGYETVVIRLADRSVYNGILKHESETELTVDCPPDEDIPLQKANVAITLKKTDIASRRVGSSPMPDGYGATLSRRDLRDLVEFLAGPK